MPIEFAEFTRVCDCGVTNRLCLRKDAILGFVTDNHSDEDNNPPKGCKSIITLFNGVVIPIEETVEEAMEIMGRDY
jgi:hypothetical protein